MGTIRKARSGMLLRVAAAAAAGTVLALGHPPVGIPTAAPIGVALLTAATFKAQAKLAALLGAVSGVIYFGIMTSWVTVFGTDAFLALVTIGTGWFTLMGVGLALVSKAPLWPLTTALVWSLQELLFGRAPFGGFPWARLAYSQIGSPGANLASLFSVAGLSFFIALTGTLLAYCAITIARDTHTRKRLLAGLGALACLLIPLGGTLVHLETSGQQGRGPAQARVAIIQGGQDPGNLNAYERAKERIERYSKLTQDLAQAVAEGQSVQPELVIWPENSANLDPYTSREAQEAVNAATTAIGTPALIGAVTVAAGPGTMENRAVLWRPGTGPDRHYAKTRPVPFGEYLPGRELFEQAGTLWPWLGQRFSWLEKDFTSGTGSGYMRIDQLDTGIAICFEVAYDHVMRQTIHDGSRLSIIPTNNALWSGSAGVDQQFAIARMRAIEHNRTTITAATTGTTAVIRPDGSIQAQLPPETKAVLAETVALRDNITPAVKYGAAIETVLLALGVLALGIGTWRARVKRAKAATTQRRK